MCVRACVGVIKGVFCVFGSNDYMYYWHSSVDKQESPSFPLLSPRGLKSSEPCRAEEWSGKTGLKKRHGIFLMKYEAHMWGVPGERSVPTGLLQALIPSASKADGLPLVSSVLHPLPPLSNPIRAH